MLFKGRTYFSLCACGIAVFFILNYFIWRGELLAWKDYTRVRTWQGLSEADEIAALQRKIPNLPVKFWYAHRLYDMKLNASCALFPDIMQFDYVHEHWQLLTTTKGNVKLLAAFLDDRPAVNTVRLLGMIDRRNPVDMVSWCQLWFHDRKHPVIVPVEEYFYLWYDGWGQKNEGEYQPYLLSCKLPPQLSYAVPSSVALTENYCDNAMNSLRVSYDKPAAKKGFAVCTKGVNFVNDITVRLVEWIEYLLLLGVDKIYMYDIIVTPQVERLFDYYTRKGVLDISSLMLPQVQLNEPYLQHMFLEHDANMQAEVIPYTQCFLQHMYEYEYIAILDTDEVIVPQGGMPTWRDLVKRAKHRAEEEHVAVGSFISRNCYFFDNSTLKNVKPSFSLESYNEMQERLDALNIPDYMHMAQRVFRSMNCTPPGFYIKSIHSTDAVVAVHNHYHLKTIADKWINFDFLLEEGYMHHYRHTCPGELGAVCYNDFQKEFEYDDSILTHYERLRTNVVRALDDLGYF